MRRANSEQTDMTPMVDVTFLLLIFFMVTASFSLQKSVAMPPQQSESAQHRVEPLELELQLQVDRFGSFVLILPEAVVETPGKQRLAAALKAAAAEYPGELSLSVAVADEAKLRWLVDAMDAATTAGIDRIRIESLDDI